MRRRSRTSGSVLKKGQIGRGQDTGLPEVGLLGNPGDIYGLSGVGFAFTDFAVDLELGAASEFELPNAILDAGWTVFRNAFEDRGQDFAERPFAITFSSDIPLQSGLSGSSAILVAELRAFSRWFEIMLPPHRLAELAWQAERHELQTIAGPMDRLVQAHEGLVEMDCADPWVPRSTRQLDPSLLPPCAVCWDPNPGVPSGSVHAPVFARWRRGDRKVMRWLTELAEVARDGCYALEHRDLVGLCDAVDRNFDLRAQLFPIGDRDREMIELGRACGAATKFCGSGGSVLVVPRMGSVEEVITNFREAGFAAIEPTLTDPDFGDPSFGDAGRR